MQNKKDGVCFVSHLVDNELTSYADKLMSDYYSKLRSQYEEKMTNYLKENLAKLGYTFSSNEEFIEFCKNRITRVTYTHSNEIAELYLDFDPLKKENQLVGSYSEKLDIFYNTDYSVTMTIGRTFN